MDSGVNITHDRGDGVLVLATSDTTLNSWVIDSGASFHASSCSEAFTNYKEGKLACEIIGKGDILLSAQLLLQDVRHVPKLKRNLIFSISYMLKIFLHSLQTHGKLPRVPWLLPKGIKLAIYML